MRLWDYWDFIRETIPSQNESEADGTEVGVRALFEVLRGRGRSSDRVVRDRHSVVYSILSSGSFSAEERGVAQAFHPQDAWASSQSNRNKALLPRHPNREDIYLRAFSLCDTWRSNSTFHLLHCARTTPVVASARYIPTNQLFPSYPIGLTARP